MAQFRFKKVYSKDVSSYTTMKDMSKNARIGTIDSVDPENGTCTIRWLDRPGFRANVRLSQGTHNEWSIPERGAVGIFVTDSKDQTYLVRYINLGHESRVKTTKTLPKLKAGEKLWEVGGSWIYMKSNGDIVLETAETGYLTLENSSSTLKSETINWKVISEGGENSFGILKRPYVNTDGTISVELIQDPLNQPFTEYRLRVVEKADNQLGANDLQNPLYDIIIGTVANDPPIMLGKALTYVSGKEVPVDANSSNALCIRLVVKQPVTGIELLRVTLDKLGNLNFESKAPAGITNMNFQQLFLNTLASLVINNGVFGAARVNDSVRVDVPIGGIIVNTGSGQNTTPLTFTGQITSGSPTVMIG
jgi:hypothetical protein